MLTTLNQNVRFESGWFLNGWRLVPDSISENEIPIILGYCEKSQRMELAVFLLGKLSGKCCRIIENQIDLLVIEELINQTSPELSFMQDWAIKRQLILNVDTLCEAVADQGVIGLIHQENLWVVHPSAKKPNFWQATHYDLVSCSMTVDTLHESLELLFHCSGAGIHPRSQLMNTNDVEDWLCQCHDIQPPKRYG